MQKLAVVLVTLLVVLLGMAPLPARADGPETKVEGIVQAGPVGTGITGLPAGAEVEAKWETTVSGPTAGKECQVKNESTVPVTRAKGTTGATTTNFPSNHLACTIATSTITGIVAGNVLCVDVNFSDKAVIPHDVSPCTNQDTVPSNRWRVRIDASATAFATSSITELEVESED